MRLNQLKNKVGVGYFLYNKNSNTTEDNINIGREMFSWGLLNILKKLYSKLNCKRKYLFTLLALTELLTFIFFKNSKIKFYVYGNKMLVEKYWEKYLLWYTLFIKLTYTYTFSLTGIQGKILFKVFWHHPNSIIHWFASRAILSKYKKWSIFC